MSKTTHHSEYLKLTSVYIKPVKKLLSQKEFEIQWHDLTIYRNQILI